jgi:hypothetical protein
MVQCRRLSSTNLNCWGVMVRVGLWFSIDNMVRGQRTPGDYSQCYSSLYNFSPGLYETHTHRICYLAVQVWLLSVVCHCPLCIQTTCKQCKPSHRSSARDHPVTHEICRWINFHISKNASQWCPHLEASPTLSQKTNTVTPDGSLGGLRLNNMTYHTLSLTYICFQMILDCRTDYSSCTFGLFGFVKAVLASQKCC